MISFSQRRAATSVRSWSLLATAATWVGLLGPAWSFVPARPAAHTPAVNLNFAELAWFSAELPSTFQSYFNVGAWVLAVVITALAAYTGRGHGLVWGLLSVLVGSVSLTLTLMALHSLPTTGNAWHTITSIRLGAALTLLGAVALARAGYLAVVTDLRTRKLVAVPAPAPSATVWAE